MIDHFPILVALDYFLKPLFTDATHVVALELVVEQLSAGRDKPCARELNHEGRTITPLIGWTAKIRLVKKANGVLLKSNFRKT